mgnify:CR=1 FL=1
MGERPKQVCLYSRRFLVHFNSFRPSRIELLIHLWQFICSRVGGKFAFTLLQWHEASVVAMEDDCFLFHLYMRIWNDFQGPSRVPSVTWSRRRHCSLKARKLDSTCRNASPLSKLSWKLVPRNEMRYFPHFSYQYLSSSLHLLVFPFLTLSYTTYLSSLSMRGWHSAS